MIIFRPSCGLSSAVGCEGAPHFNAFIRSDFVCSEGDTLYAGWYLSSKTHRPLGTAHAANSFKSRSLASWPLCLPAPFWELFGCSAKGKAIATRVTLTGCRGAARLPAALLRFRLPAVLCVFGPSGAFSGAFGLLPVHLPGRLPLRPSCVPFWPSLLPFSIRAAACCSASALPSIAAGSAFLKRKGRPASCRGLLRCFAACFGPAGVSQHTD